jgi:hypothetical protein
LVWRCLSDALSSAYATQEILVILGAAGVAAFVFAFPISIAIVILLAIVTVSYEQTIHAYPGGGGAYIVARDNLGELPAQTAGAALLTDYILTVADLFRRVAQLVVRISRHGCHRYPLQYGFLCYEPASEESRFFSIPTYFS